MKLYILPTILIILEITFFLYTISKDYNERFRETAQRMKEKIIKKTKLDLNTELKDFSRRDYIIFLGIFVFTIFLDDRMAATILVTVFMIILLRFRIPYEKFEKIFINYKPSLKKYNIYLLTLLLIQIITIALTVLLAG